MHKRYETIPATTEKANFRKLLLPLIVKIWSYLKTDSVLWLLRTMLGVIRLVCSSISLSLGVKGISGKEFRCVDMSKLLLQKEERGVVLYEVWTCCDIFSFANSMRSYKKILVELMTSYSGEWRFRKC